MHLALYKVRTVIHIVYLRELTTVELGSCRLEVYVNGQKLCLSHPCFLFLAQRQCQCLVVVRIYVH